MKTLFTLLAAALLSGASIAETAAPDSEGFHRPRPRPYPGRYVSFVCYARDSGWEEHWRGHPGYGRTYWQAQRAAIWNCQRHHGRCYVSSCQRAY